MKSLCVALALWSGFVQAQTQVQVKNFSFSYQNPHGQGEATSFSRNKFSANEKVNVTVDRIDQDFHLQVTGGENESFVLKNAPSFMTDADTISINGFNLDFNEQLNLSLSSGKFDSKSDSLQLDGLTLSCQKLGPEENIMDQLITGCIQKMSLKSSKFSSAGAEDLLASALDEAFVSVLGGVGVNSIALSTNAGKYELAAEVKAQISGKVKSSGNLSYDASSGKLTVKISEVKFGILNITSKVFDELKKQESAKLSVKAPYVYLLLK